MVSGYLGVRNEFMAMACSFRVLEMEEVQRW